MRERSLELLKKISVFAKDIVEALQNPQTEYEDFAKMLVMLAKCIRSIKEVVPASVYGEYEEFFEMYAGYCEKCESIAFLEKTTADAVGCLDLFVVCMEQLIEKYEQLPVRKCACCGNEVIFKPLSKYYEDKEKEYGFVRQSCLETLNKDEYTCPNCLASDRDRLMVSFLKKLELEEAVGRERMLQIAPSKAIESWIYGNCPGLLYDSTDLYMENVSFQADIQDMHQIKEESYDYFICSHVLEHVEDDQKAMRELYRILKEDGMGLFLVPLDLNVKSTDEEFGLSEAENWRRFGQGDHCRRYAKNDLLERLKEAGFYVHQMGKEYFGEAVFAQNGLTDTSVLYVLTKTDDSIDTLIAKIKGRRKQTEKTMPLVSVYLPCYNHEEYVEESIESILNQTYKNIELVVMDDGSADKTPEKIKQYADKIDELYLFKENTKGTKTIEIQEKMRGKYIAVAHSDDVWALDKLEKQVLYMETHPECMACFTGCGIIDEKGDKVSSNLFKKQNMNRALWLRDLFDHGNCLAHPSILIHKDLYIRLHDQYKNRMFWQLPDFWTWLNLLLGHEIHVIEENLAFFRFHEKGKNKNTSARTQENICRHAVEEAYIWYTIFKRMDNETFLRAFKDRLVDKEVSDEKEILCEKMFVLLNHKYGYAKQSGIFFMYDVCQIPEVLDILDKKYGWSLSDIKKNSGEFLMNL